jgi:hypothetical protein
MAGAYEFGVGREGAQIPGTISIETRHVAPSDYRRVQLRGSAEVLPATMQQETAAVSVGKRPAEEGD